MEDKKKRNQYKFDKRKYDHIHIQIPSGQKGTLQAAAIREGESINGYVNKAVLARMGVERWADLGSDHQNSPM